MLGKYGSRHGLDSRVDAICGLSLSLVFIPAPRVFSRYAGFPSSTRTHISKLQFDLETVVEEPLCGCTTEIPIYLFIYLFIYCAKTYLSRSRSHASPQPSPSLSF